MNITSGKSGRRSTAQPPDMEARFARLPRSVQADSHFQHTRSSPTVNDDRVITLLEEIRDLQRQMIAFIILAVLLATFLWPYTRH